MERLKESHIFRLLTGYYGLLQSIHLLLLARAGWILLQGREIPFPAPPPGGGWPDSSLPFLLGMGFVDVFAIGLGLIFVYVYFQREKVLNNLGLISLTAAIASGIVYLIGTLPSGAWGANLMAYLAVLVFFSPILPLYYYLIQAGSKAS